jgi:hypothetical protein
LELLKAHAGEPAELALRHPALQPQHAQLVPDHGIFGTDAALAHVTSEKWLRQKSVVICPDDLSKRIIYTIKPAD